MQGKRVLLKTSQKLQAHANDTNGMDENRIRILKCDTPMDRGPILTPVAQADREGLTEEEKEKKAREERLILDKMIWLSKAYPGVGLDNIFGGGPSSSRPPDQDP